MTELEPGWYRNPEDPKSHRYWNGAVWEGHRPSQDGDVLAEEDAS